MLEHYVLRSLLSDVLCFTGDGVCANATEDERAGRLRTHTSVDDVLKNAGTNLYKKARKRREEKRRGEETTISSLILHFLGVDEFM